MSENIQPKSGLVEKSWGVKAVAILEIINGIAGLGVLLWAFGQSQVVTIHRLFIIMMSCFFLWAGIQLLKDFGFGVKLSLIAQAIAVPRILTRSGDSSFNNVIHVPLTLSTPTLVIGVDLLALGIVFYLLSVRRKWHNHSLQSDGVNSSVAFLD